MPPKNVKQSTSTNTALVPASRARTVNPTPSRNKKVLAMLLRDPSLEKFVVRAERQGYSGEALFQNVVKRAEASELSHVQSRALERARELAKRGLPVDGTQYFGYVNPAFGRTAEPLSPQMRGVFQQSSQQQQPFGYPRTGLSHPTRISQAGSYLSHEKYPEFYVRNFSRAYPMPLAANNNIANKTLPITATVSTAFTVPGGCYCIIAPTPDHPENVPYVSMMISPSAAGADPTVRTVTMGTWFGNISPQGLCGASPNTGNVDDRSLQFKAGVSEISLSVAYNAAASVGYLDPYTTLDYGKALGYVRPKLPTYVPDQAAFPLSAEVEDWPYTTQRNFINFSELMGNAIRQSLVGSSRQSSVVYRQLIKPVGNSFNPAVLAGSINAATLNRIGWPPNTPISNSTSSNLAAGDMGIFGQGLYLIDNRNSLTAVSVEMAMDMHYRVRVDNQAPAVYMMADDRSTPKHSITWEPSTAMAGGRTAAVEASHKANATSAHAPPPKPITPAASAIKGDSLPSSSSSSTGFLEKIPVVGKGVGKAVGGLERAFTKGDDVGELIGGLGDFAMGTLDTIGSLFSFFD